MRRFRTDVLALAVVFAGVALAAWWARGEAGPATGGSLSASRPASSPATASAPASSSAPAVRAVHVFVSGRVQGVGFRDFVAREARARNLAGWVKNLYDGRVEAVVEGAPDAVAALLEKMKKGPSSAKVTDLKAADQPATGEFKEFQVK